MKLLSLFSGIGAFEKALDRLNINYELVNYCEIDKYASKAYAMMHDCDESLNLGDITKIDTTALPNDIDLITYGFPCQDISLAGKQKGFEEDGERTRSGLFFEALRIIEDKKPKVAVCENVKNLTSKKFQKEFNIVLSSLEEAGYKNYWKVLNAKDYGIPQNRERVFIVSIREDLDSGLFKFPEPLELKLKLWDMLDREVDYSYYLTDEQISKILSWKAHQKPFEKVLGKNSICPTLTARGAGENHSGMILFNESQENTENIQEYLMIREATKKGYAEAYIGDSVNLEHPNSETRRGRVGKQVAQTLTTSCNQGVIVEELALRKLTPKECWRLTGFDDEDFNKITGISNTQLYKQAGNSIVVDVLVHLFETLFKALESNKRAEIIKQPTLFDLDKEEEFMEEKQKLITNENMIKWNEIDDLIGKPVFDKDNDAWRILNGYQRVKKDYFVSFTDSDDFEEIDLNRTNLYRNEELAYKK